ncbi:hypothetical protein ENKNEFLB_02641 [Nocardioides aquaticus]|uniref:DUF4203 domain-containing protein n=1 Tax=Nocardioides aquaticus TaxID=160826 RepID=A0ABX8EIB2_9ACTN|nr:DUF4203 domain-containing protein [Nocardioides aquaticus]QVT80250.1 hypothetical protein ENKNEFLB_02641 [Nocardioides aquaticus]
MTQDIVFGTLALLAGVLLCFRGYAVLRLAIAVWGAFVGFSLGAGLASALTGDRFLGTVLGWTLGVALALVLALLAYLYYAVGVVIATASAGFALGAALIVAIGVDWSWAIVLAGLLVGALLALLAVLADLPTLLLVVVGALAGASVTVTGLMLLSGVIESADFDDAAATGRIQDDWWWYLLFLVLAVAGVAAQSRDAADRRGTQGSRP